MGILDGLTLVVDSLLLVLGSVLARLGRKFLHRSDLGFGLGDYSGHDRILKVHGDVERLRHIPVEVHSASHRAHLAVTPHELVTGDDHRRGALAKVIGLHEVVVVLRQDGLEHRAEVILVGLCHFRLDLLTLWDEVVYRV